MSVAIATMGLYRTVGTAGEGTGDPVYIGGGVGGAGGGVERKKPVVLVSMVHEQKKEEKIIKVILVDEV